MLALISLLVLPVPLMLLTIDMRLFPKTRIYGRPEQPRRRTLLSLSCLIAVISIACFLNVRADPHNRSSVFGVLGIAVDVIFISLVYGLCIDRRLSLYEWMRRAFYSSIAVNLVVTVVSFMVVR